MQFQGLLFCAVFLLLELVVCQEVAKDVFLFPRASDVIEEGVPYTITWNTSAPSMLLQTPGVLIELILYYSNGTEQAHEQVPNNGGYDWTPKVGLGGYEYYFQLFGSARVEELILSEKFTIVEGDDGSEPTATSSSYLNVSTPSLLSLGHASLH